VCEKYGDLMMKYMDGLLDDFEQMNLDKHMEACEVCREDFAIYQEMLTEFDSSIEEIIEAPDSFAASVMEKIDDINIYFPKKVRDKGKLLDGLIFAVWMLMATAFAGGTALYFQSDSIFNWMDANGLGVAIAVLQPFADFAASFGMTLEQFVVTASGWLGANLADFSIMFLPTVLILVGVQFYMSPKYAKVYADFKKKRRKIL